VAVAHKTAVSRLLAVRQCVRFGVVVGSRTKRVGYATAQA